MLTAITVLGIVSAYLLLYVRRRWVRRNRIWAGRVDALFLKRAGPPDDCLDVLDARGGLLKHGDG